LSHEALVGVQGPLLSIMITLLLAQNVLAKCVVLDGEIAIKQLQEWVVDGSTASQDL
jgi:hypothetical protein